jgi:DNA invertase Pin-like site-specific DNA recombinase
MSKFVGYYRVSTEKQGRSGLGLEAQRQAVRQYVAHQGGHLLTEYKDVSSGRRTDRAGLQAAILDCQQHKAVLIVATLDRLSRDGFRILIQLEEAGVSYIDASSPQDNELIKAIKFSFAKDERQKIAERTRAALAVKKSQGVKLGTPDNLTDAGRRVGQQVRQENARLNIRNRQAGKLAKLLHERGESLSEIARQLNAHGFTARRGGTFHPMQVRRLLERKV